MSNELFPFSPGAEVEIVEAPDGGGDLVAFRFSPESEAAVKDLASALGRNREGELP